MSNITQALFKHIPCPNGDACTANKCLFGHSRDHDSPSPAATAAAPAVAPAAAPATEPDNMTASTLSARAVSYDGGHIAKRAKISPSGQTAAATAAATVPVAPPAPATRTATISPPPLKRKREDRALPAAGAVPKQKPASAAAAAPLRKPELLNPRLVNKAPAKHEIRLRLLKLIHSEFTRLNKLLLASKDKPAERKLYVLTEQGLIWAALDLEEHYALSKSPAVYSDSVKHRIMEYKRMTVGQWINERKAAREAREKAIKERKAAAAAAAGKQATDPSPSGSTAGSTPVAATPVIPPPEPIETGLPPEQEFVLLEKHFLTPINGLAQHGYVPQIPSASDIQKARDAEEANQGWEQCDRCQSRFQVFPGRRETDGALASGGQCQHHPGRYNRSTQVYACCNESADLSVGCVVAANHVFKTKDPKRMAALWNFCETPANPSVPVDQAVCFDCEMAYTVHGMEVVRLTVTAWPGGDRLLDVLVRPKGAVMDLNSRYSGIWPEDFANAIPFSGTSAKDVPVDGGKDGGKEAASSSSSSSPSGRPALPLVPSPEVARTLFYSLIRPETVLIGHALENDLNTMRMVHTRVCDTVLLFPHPKGLPIRNGLRVLAREHMGRLIQAAALAGHDSAEDARAAGDLVRTKIKAKWAAMQLQGWRMVGQTMRQAK